MRIYGMPRPRFANGHAYTPMKAREYKNAIACMARKQHDGILPEAPLHVIFYFNVATTNKKRLGFPQTTKPDWDNAGKIICDALNGIAWRDDSLVAIGTVVKAWDYKDHITVRITELENTSCY